MDWKQRAEVSRDIYTALYEDTKRRLVATGIYTEEEASEQAYREIRDSIRNDRR